MLTSVPKSFQFSPSGHSAADSLALAVVTRPGEVRQLRVLALMKLKNAVVRVQNNRRCRDLTRLGLVSGGNESPDAGEK